MVILLEFQGRPDRLMALRMAIYQLLTVQEVIRRARPSVRTDSIEVLSFVIHHGRRPWGKAPSLRQLFGRLVPGFFRMIEPDWDAGAAHATGDLVGIILALERNRSVDGTVAMVQALARIAEETDSAYNSFIAACVREMLVSRGWITREQLKEAGTMTQVSTAYRQSLEDYGQRWFRQGREEGVRQGREEGVRQGREEGVRQGREEGVRQGREEGVRRERHAQTALLCRRASQRFGADVAEALTALLGDSADFSRVVEAMDAVVSSATGDELLERVRRMPKG